MSIIRLRGYFTLVYGKHHEAGRNLVTELGLFHVAQFVSGTTPLPAHAKWIAWGSSGTTPLKSQTALVGVEHGRAAATPAPTNPPALAKMSISTTPAAGQQVREFGIFNAAAAGVMFARFICREFTTNGADPLQLTWELVVE